VPPELGVCSFDLVVDSPDPAKIPNDEFLGVTVVMVQALYKGKEFVRVGYYVKVEYADEKLRDEPPAVERPDVELLQRNILANEPRVTRYLIEWDDPIMLEQPAGETQEGMEGVTTPAPEEHAVKQEPSPMAGIPQPQYQPAAVAASGE
jgi:histone chaperone ASF1